MKKFARWRRGVVAPVALAAVCALAGCQSTPDGEGDGLAWRMLPGMEPPGATLTSAEAAKLNAPQSISQATQVRMPTGACGSTRRWAGCCIPQAWYSSTGMPMRSVIYADGACALRYYEYGDDGHVQRVTTWFPGTTQAQRWRNMTSRAERDGVHGILAEWKKADHFGVERGDAVWSGAAVEEWYDNGAAEVADAAQ